MKNLLSRFFLSLAFIGLVFLALNPRVVLDIQSRLGLTDDKDNLETESRSREEIEPDIIDAENIEPETQSPDIVKETPAPVNIPTPRRKPPAIVGTQPLTDIAEIRPTPAPSPVPQIPDLGRSVPAPLQTKNPFTFPITASPDLNNLPRLADYETIDRGDPWIGPTPCGSDIFDVPTSLTGVGERRDGGNLKSPISTNGGPSISNQPTYLFKSPSGVTLEVVQPVIHYYEALGRDFREAQADIFNRKPLESPDPTRINYPDIELSGNKSKITTLANIRSPTSLSFSVYGHGDQYRLLTDQIVMTAGFLITLPKWTSYDFASPEDQANWDDLFCNAAHHELGHLRIQLDILAQTLDQYASLPKGIPSPELTQLTKQLQTDISEIIDERQDAYHIYNGGGLRSGMIEKPYAELPFPWLARSDQN